MPVDPPPASPSPPGPSFAGLIPTLVISGLLPLVTYRGLRAYVPSMSDVTALGISGVFPMVHSVAGLVRRRYLDIIGIIVLVGIVVSIVATLLGGDAKILLLRESLVTAALGVVALSSFAWRRPLMFYIGLQFSSGANPEARARFEALWERPRARRVFRIMTLVWGVAWLGEFALRVAMVEWLTIPQVLAIAPVVFTGITIGLMAWTFGYARRARARAASAGP